MATKTKRSPKAAATADAALDIKTTEGIDLSGKTVQQLKNFIKNHEAQQATDKPIFNAARLELGRREHGGLDFEITRRAVEQAACGRRFLSYIELAEASGLEWPSVRQKMNAHLWALVSYADNRGWPMLSAVIVNKPNAGSGKMEPQTLKGFIAAAEALGHQVDDPEGFLRNQQERVFVWARASGSGAVCGSQGQTLAYSAASPESPPL